MKAVQFFVDEAPTSRISSAAKPFFHTPRPRKAPPVVQLNLNVNEELADIISEEAKKAGSTRRWLARVMKEAGYDVPDADLNPYMNVRKRRG